MTLSDQMDHLVRQATPWASCPNVVRLRRNIEALEKQLAAQRAIVAADDEYRRLESDANREKTGTMPHWDARTKANEAARVCRERREEAKRIDEVTR